MKVLNTVNFSGCEHAIKKLQEICIVDTIKPNKDEVLKVIHKYDVYFSSLEFRFDREIIDKATKLKLVVSPSTGTDHLDKKYLIDKGIILYDLSEELELIRTFTATSELAFTLLLNVNRRIFSAVNSIKTNNWGREVYSGNQLLGKTLGIIGMGRLGTISANIAKGFGMNIIYNDILKIESKIGQQVELDFLCKNSDYITVHVHLDDSTIDLINMNHFKMMKNSCIIINTARAKIINETDLLKSLKNKTIACAGLDMIDGEWIHDKTSHPLIQYSLKNDNLLITPHIGGATSESIYGARIFMASKLYDFVKNF